MLRTNTLELKPNRQQQQILKIMLVSSSAVWNLANYYRRQSFFDKDKEVSFYTEQYRDLKPHENYKELGSSYSQQILRKLDRSWKSFWNSLKSNNVNHKVSITTSPECQSKVKQNDKAFEGREYGYRNDRDVAGSINILKKDNHVHRPFGDIHLGGGEHPFIV
ncbi:MAG: zinc ribbon domain-containing protein [Promethearchaeia archaeon]